MNVPVVDLRVKTVKNCCCLRSPLGSGILPLIGFDGYSLPTLCTTWTTAVFLILDSNAAAAAAAAPTPAPASSTSSVRMRGAGSCRNIVLLIGHQGYDMYLPLFQVFTRPTESNLQELYRTDQWVCESHACLTDHHVEPCTHHTARTDQSNIMHINTAT